MRFLIANLVMALVMAVSVTAQEEPRTFPGGEIDSTSVQVRLQEPQGTVNADQQIFTIIEFQDFDYRPDFETDAATEFASSATINGEFVEEIQLDGLGHIHVYFQEITSGTGFPVANVKESGAFCGVSDNNTVLFNDSAGTSGFIFTLCPPLEPGLYRVCAEAQSHSHSSRIRNSADDFPGVDCNEIVVLSGDTSTTTTTTTTTVAGTTTTLDATTTTVASTTLPDTTTTTLPGDPGDVKGILETLQDIFQSVVDEIGNLLDGLMDTTTTTTTTTVADTTTTTPDTTTTTTTAGVTTTTLSAADDLLQQLRDLFESGQVEEANQLLADELPENLPTEVFDDFENELLEIVDDDDVDELEDDDVDGEDDDDDDEDEDDDGDDEEDDDDDGEPLPE